MDGPTPEPAPPPARRRPGTASLVLLAAGAAVWGVAVWRLWGSTAPSLDLPRVPASSVLDPAELRHARHVEGVSRLLTLGSQAVLLLSFVGYALAGARLAKESAAGRIGTGMLLAMLGFGIAWIPQLPFEVVGLWWARRNDLARTGYAEALFQSFAGLGGTFLFVCLGVLVVMGLARFLPRRWWVVGAPVIVGLALLQGFVSPWLVPSLSRVDDPAVAADAKRLARIEGVKGVPVLVQEVSKETDAPNAAAMGVGPSRRIVLWDTLLDGRFSREEVAVVVAHELAHVKRDHVLRSIGWFALLAVPGSLLVAVATRRRGGMREPAAVPVALLVFVGAQLVTQPLQALVTRHMEVEADWIALNATSDPAAARALYAKFARTAAADPSPPLWDYILYEDHPTLAQRIAMVRAWELRHPGARPPASTPVETEPETLSDALSSLR